MEKIPQQHGAGVYVEHLGDPVLCVIIEIFLEPFQAIVIGLPHTTKISCNGGWPPEVHVGPVGTLCIKCLHDRRPDNFHGSGYREEIAIFLLLFHIPDPDVPARHDLLLLNGLAGFRHEP